MSKIISVFLAVYVFSSPALACNKHPASVPHSEWAWMQEQAKNGVVNTKMSDSFFKSTPKEENNQQGQSTKERSRRR